MSVSDPYVNQVEMSRNSDDGINPFRKHMMGLVYAGRACLGNDEFCREYVDLGVDVSPEKFVEAIKSNENVTLVACSGLLSTTMPALKKTVETIKASGLEGFKIIVGGAPITQEFADGAGADGYAPDAGGAAVKAKELVTQA